ncbi:Pleiotropic drug resistance protein 1 [Apostasia shenzhenica]|uniref:Pleiotropic drug resistance protein 1 n=1 Tax=Apostasia shenzhenica TaxID=1088818 RepID=A0A2I0BA89_9ASPA|nr:Pleiotropic drug resistance protein 1 [Apostasia shenzhenica]
MSPSFSSSSIWRSAEQSIISRSSWAREDDEEALRWAALERLPTCNRVRKGILDFEEEGIKEIEVKKLSLHDRRRLLQRLVRDAEKDNERFLLRLKDRIDRVGIDLPTIEVRFERLNIEAEAYVGSRSLPSFFNSTLNAVEGLANYLHVLPSKKMQFNIINNVSGIINPRRMTLLLGPPGSGKTTLLLALAGKLGSDLKVSGKVTYNGHEMNEFIPQRTAAYISQHDLHMGEMTVRETLEFSARCQGVGFRYDMLTELSRREKAANIKPDPDIDIFMKASSIEGNETGVIIDYIMKILGLDTCADIFVGDGMIRGISGGQKKRVTTGEMIVGPSQALFMDEISTGLDSSTTFQIVSSIRQIIQILGGTAVLSLLQPAPETYELFDDIILLSGGHIVYQGPRQNVLEFFEFMGFKCPERKGVADYLQEVTSRKDQQQYWAQHTEEYRYVSAKEFAEAFLRFHVGEAMAKILSVPFDKSKNHRAALTTTKFGIGRIQLLKACAERELLLMKRNSFVYVFRGLKIFITALIMMTLFVRTKTRQRDIADGWIYMGSFFFSVVTMMFNGFSDLALTGAKLPVIFKQRDLLYPSWAYAISTWIVKIPFSFVEVSVWVITIYYIIGYDPSITRFFKQYLSLLLVNQMAAGLFRFIAVAGRTMVVANALAIYISAIIVALGGFVLATLGVSILKSRGIFVEEKWYWISLVAMFVYVLLFNFLFILALCFLSNKTKGTMLPFTPLSITFENIKYSVDMPQEMKAQGAEDRLVLLNGVSGCFRPGILTALMGASGAGKTTLLDVLAGRKTNGYIEGNITISGYPKKQETFARVCGYCEQYDIHSPHMTVYESLIYSAWLRLPASIDYATREIFVEEIMDLVEMTPLRKALVGLPGVCGLSTEQRKRLSIAVELVANPSIIFMDEPTSGLDARAAAIVMRVVRKTVDIGRTIVCTIHQPSIDIFETFDELLLMKRGGEEIYVGPLGNHSCHLIKYFEGVNGVAKIKDGYNPATWMLEITTPAQEQILHINFSEVYKKSFLYKRNATIIKDLSKPLIGSSDLCFPTQYPQSLLNQCIACLWKQHWSYWRNSTYTTVRFFLTVIIALSCGAIFWDLGGKRGQRQDLFNAMGSMYCTVFFMGISYSFGVLPIVSVERAVFYRERAAGMYSSFPYAFAQVVIEQPYVLIQTLVYSFIVYTMIGFESSTPKFLWFIFFTYFTLLYFTYYGMATVALTPNFNIATVLCTIFYGVWSLFSGFVIPRTAIPIWWRWCYWVCPIAWSLYGLFVSQFGDVEDKLDTNETVIEFLRKYFGFNPEFLDVVSLVVIFLVAFFAILYGMAIKLLNFQKR